MKLNIRIAIAPLSEIREQWMSCQLSAAVHIPHINAAAVAEFVGFTHAKSIIYALSEDDCYCLVESKPAVPSGDATLFSDARRRGSRMELLTLRELIKGPNLAYLGALDATSSEQTHLWWYV